MCPAEKALESTDDATDDATEPTDALEQEAEPAEQLADLVDDLPDVTEMMMIPEISLTPREPTVEEILKEDGPAGVGKYLAEHPGEAARIQEELTLALANGAGHAAAA